MSSIVKLPLRGQPVPDIEAPRPKLLVVGIQDIHDGMEGHVIDAASHMGCAVEFFAATPFHALEGQGAWRKVLEKCSKAFLREPERLVERRLAETVERLQPELILVVLGSQLSPKTVNLLRARTTAPIVCWCQDQMTTIGRQYLVGAGYDAVFMKDRYLQELFARMVRSTPFHYLPEACNPRMHRTLPLTADDRRRYGCDVMMAGTLYYYRQEILRALAGFDLRVYGNRPDWLIDRLAGRRIGAEVKGDAKVRAARAATVALNTLHYAEVDSLNVRAFELAGIGAFQLLDHKPVLAEHFRPGEEVETFRDVDELVEKVRWFVRHPERARAIGDAGQRRAHRDHSYEARLDEIFRVALGSRQAQA